MSFLRYIKDRLISIVVFFLYYFFFLMILFVFKVPRTLVIVFTLFCLFLFSFSFLYDFFRKKKFYDELCQNVALLDKKYLVVETLSTPNFYEGELFVQNLYDINKSMIERVNKKERSIEDFKDYIEMWIHEAKIPISSLTLMCHNHQEIDKKVLEQIKRLDNYVEQVLYYVRSEHAEKDYLIKEVSLKKMLNTVALKNREDLLENKIDLLIEIDDVKIRTDEKWLEFIVNQIINNAIKYKNKENAYIKINTNLKGEQVFLIIEDNGMGISSSDLPKVFEKSFTGKNGRIMTKSTGMGLYIASSLCKKLGHKIQIDSKEGIYTKVTLTFSLHSFYDVVK